MIGTFVTAVLLIALQFPVACDADQMPDGNAMDGTWSPVSGELAGNKFPDEILKTIKLVLKGNAYTVTVGKKVDKGTVKIDAGKSPKSMDITGTDGPNKGKTYLAIYDFKKDRLKVCYDLSGKSRPTEFKTKPGTLLYLVTYKRSK